MAKLKSLFAARDMTEGTPWKRIVEFSIPLLIGNIAQQFYNTADSIIVGRYIGDNALAAVGSAGPVLNLFLVLLSELLSVLELWLLSTSGRKIGNSFQKPLEPALP